MASRRGGLIAGSVLSVLALACFSRLVASPGALLVDGQQPSVDYAQRDIRDLGNDLTYVLLPHFLHVAEQVGRLGRLPQWDSSGFAGRPMIGNPQAGLFYPPYWIALASGSPASLGWITLAHLVWAGVGVFVLMRRLGAGVAASTVAAGCFQACPYVLAHTFEGHYPHVWAVSWYPWAFWAYRELRQARWAGGATLPAILALCFLAGHPQEWFYLVFVLGAWALADAASRARSDGVRGGISWILLWSCVLGVSVGLMAVELVPDLMAQGWTLSKSRFALGKVNHYQLHALSVFQLLSPTSLGGPADYFGHDNYWESLLSIGLVPLILASIAAGWHKDRAMVRGWLILIGVTLLFAAGRRMGLFTLLFELVPGMNRFRVPSRSLFLTSLGTSVLAGLGVDALLQRAPSTVDWRRMSRGLGRVALALVVGLLLLAAIAGPEPPRPTGRIRPKPQFQTLRLTQRRPTSEPYLFPRAGLRLVESGIFWLALVGAVGLVTLGAYRPSTRRFSAAALGGLALIELALHGQALLKVSSPEPFLGADPVSTTLAQQSRPFAGPFRIRTRDTLYHDVRATAHGFEKININDSFQIQHAADLYESLYALLYLTEKTSPREVMGEAVAQHYREVRQGVLDRLNVAFLVSDHIEPEPHWPLLASGTWDGSTYAIHRNPTAMPRAYVVPRAEPTSDDPSAVRAAFGRSDPRRSVLMPDDPLGPDGPRQPFTPAEWTSDDPDRVVVKVRTQAPGLLVVADTWLPGWTASVDGRASTILRGNHAQRVIPLPSAGTHEIVMRYEAPGFGRGLAITSVTLVIWGVLVVVGLVTRPSTVVSGTGLASSSP